MPDYLIAHVDLDAFFASIEQRDNPEYLGKPLIVGALPGKRGVVAACSYEARRFGIHSAMPVSEAYRRCPDGVYLRPNMQKYRDESRRIMALLDAITPVVEKASIDEAYLDISGLESVSGNPEAIGHAIRKRIVEATELTASVGIGPNRLIAKLASEACKPDGLKVVAEDAVLDFLAPMPISNLRGLGRQTLKKIAALNIETIADLREFPLERLEACVGRKAAVNFKRQAHGISSVAVVTDRQRKSISKETTFGTDVTDSARLHDTLRDLAADVARTARREDLAGRIVTLKIRFSGFETHTRQTSLDRPTHDERLMLETAWSLYKDSDLPDKAVRLIGVGLSAWAEVDPDQADLFGSPGHAETDKKILETIDKLADKYGKPVLRVGLSKQ
jgi:DNA polymerase-4